LTSQGSAIDRVLAALRDRGEVKVRGKGWKACCPAHDDTTPSLDIDVGDGGRVLLICRAGGCKANAIAAALGLKIRDLFDDDATAAKSSPEDRITATYDYRDEAGKVLYQAVRLWAPAPKNKEFRQRRRDPSKPGGWDWSLGETRRVIYRLPELIASDSAKTVYVVEGEKDVENLARLGLVATTNPMGAGKWRKEYAPWFKDRTVCVLADNDEPGKKHAEDVRRSLEGTAKAVWVVILPGLAEKGDVSDWITEQEQGAAESIDLVAIAATLEAASKKPSTSRFKFVDSEQFLAGDYRLEFLVPRVLVKGQPAVIGGPSKTLKTSLCVDLAVSMSTATSFLGAFPVHNRRRVAIASGESGEFTLKETCLRILRSKGLEPSHLNGWLKWEFTLPTFSDLSVMADFARRLADLAVEVVLIDPTYLALGDVDAKSVFEMGRALRPVAEYLLSRGVTPILVHHSNRLLPVGEVMGLEHLSHAGLAEYARQWLLLNRREKYKGNGEHDLWVSIGGSAGHGGIWSLRVEEGVLDESFGNRRWDLTLRTLDEIEGSTIEQREEARRETVRKKHQAEQAAVLLAIDAEVASGKTGATRRALRDRSGFGDPKIKEVVESLIEEGVIEEIEVTYKAGRSEKTTSGFRRIPT